MSIHKHELSPRQKIKDTLLGIILNSDYPPKAFIDVVLFLCEKPNKWLGQLVENLDVSVDDVKAVAQELSDRLSPESSKKSVAEKTTNADL